MQTFIKSQFTSIAATAIDFMVTVIGVALFDLLSGAASAIGNVAGAITSFSLNRKWTFGNSTNKLGLQAKRYALVWCGYFALNVSLVTALTMLTSINYIIVKTGVAIALSIGYNYGLYKKYVFR